MANLIKPLEEYLALIESNQIAYLYYSKQGRCLICSKNPQLLGAVLNPPQLKLVAENTPTTYTFDKRFESISALKKEMKEGDFFYVFSQHPGKNGPWYHVSKYKPAKTKMGYKFLENLGGHIHQKDANGLYRGRPSLLQKDFVEYLSMQTFKNKDKK